MQQTTNYELNKFDSFDLLETDSRIAFNDNFDTLDTTLKSVSDKADNNESDIDTLATEIDTLDTTKANKTSLDEQTRRINNLYRLAEGKVYEFETDNTVAYSKSVLSGAMGGAIKKLGGKTVVKNQLIQDIQKHADTYNDVSFTKNVDGSFTLNGTATATFWTAYNLFMSNDIWAKANHKYLCMLIGGNTQIDNLGFTHNGTNIELGNNIRLFYYNGVDDYANVHVHINSGTVFNNDTYRMALCDLTQWYGAGNEPTSLDDERVTVIKQYLVEHPDYNTGSLVSAEVESVDTFKADTTPLDSFPIPQEIQNLDGYGWSAGNVYNEVDFENKKFIKRVGSVDLGTFSWVFASPNRFYSFDINGLVKNYDSSNIANCVCSIYTTVSRATIMDFDKVVSISSNNLGDASINIHDSAYSDVQTFKSAMNGVMLYYELATPVETDISAYIDGTTIEVENGGTITFTQDELHIPVPNEEEYLVQLANS